MAGMGKGLAAAARQKLAIMTLFFLPWTALSRRPRLWCQWRCLPIPLTELLSLAVGDPSKDGDQRTHDLYDVEGHEAGLYGDDHELVHVDQNQETGGTDETLAPNTREADAHAHNATGEDPDDAEALEVGQLG